MPVELRTPSARLAKRVREVVPAAHPGVRFSIRGLSAWGERPDRVLVRWVDGPPERPVALCALAVVDREALVVRRGGRPETLAEFMHQGALGGLGPEELVEGFREADLVGLVPGPRARALARVVDVHLSWRPPRNRGYDGAAVRDGARAHRTAQLAVELSSRSEETLEVFASLAGDRAGSLTWKQYLKMAEDLTT